MLNVPASAGSWNVSVPVGAWAMAGDARQRAVATAVPATANLRAFIGAPEKRAVAPTLLPPGTSAQRRPAPEVVGRARRRSRWLQRSARERRLSGMLDTGQAAPDFTLPDQD